MLLKFLSAVKTLRITGIKPLKAKSERINALRKQYDAFLEEDRKRKGRNDYIMGWLDKFQTSSTVSSVRFQERATSCHHIRLLQRPEYEEKKQNILCSPNIKHPFAENFEEAAILKAVSQKYILIPKISSENYNNPNVYNEKAFSTIENDSDWKHKYNILDELKEDQKSSQHTEYMAKDDTYHDLPTKDVLLTNQNSSFDLNKESQPVEDILCNENIKKLPTSETHLKQDNEYKLHEKNGLDKINNVTNPNEFNIECDPNEKILVSDCLDKIVYSEISNMPETQIAPLNDYEIRKSDSKTNNRDESLKDNNDNKSTALYVTKSDYNTMNNELISQNAQPNFNNATQDYNSSSIDLSDRKEVTDCNNLPMNQQIESSKDIHNENMNIEEHSSDVSELRKIPNPSPEIEVMTPQTIESNVEDQSQIQEFETEQKDLFYPEDQNVNYSYNEVQVASDIYKNNEQYSYYEATKEDPNQYVTDVNEHEESTEQYDPHYQEQFSTYQDNPIQTPYTTEDYSQNEGVDYQQQQFYENYGQQQADTILDTQQQLHENAVYEENPGNIENIYIQDYAQETLSQNEVLENVVERQLNIEDGLSGGDEAVVANINEKNASQEKLSTDLNVA
ncbi:MATH and LRR domain-containing protein PFE0570w-like [Pieris rapae]|uniref:MATH and LRR domain-containing protein PFE0570w-like n=1 Tax=Pieris rapae TaxID=64459 RepID=UPI001E27B985|nr:MATH and LRR domain-containing protein PFE0570w-like [Pieris rapae]